jgi:hypothetical protein
MGRAKAFGVTLLYMAFMLGPMGLYMLQEGLSVFGIAIMALVTWILYSGLRKHGLN